MKRLSFITQFKIEFLLPFLGVEKCLEKCVGMYLKFEVHDKLFIDPN